MAISFKLPIVAATAAAIMALVLPVTAQASTHSARPTIVSVQPTTTIPAVAANGNGKAWTITLSNGDVCSWVIGDHSMTNYTASGEADIKCPQAYAYDEWVQLDYAYTIGGHYKVARKTGWVPFTRAGGTYWDLWTTPGVCWQGLEPTLYWTTIAWISINGGANQEAWSQTYKKFEPAHC